MSLLNSGQQYNWDNPPLCNDCTSKQPESIRFAVINFLEGQLDKLQNAVKLANIDWSDSLVRVDFSDDINYHEEWSKKYIKPIYVFTNIC